MLDAAHGERVGPVVVVKRVHARSIEEETARVEIAGSSRRRRPPMALRADVRQGSRLAVAVARSNV